MASGFPDDLGAKCLRPKSQSREECQLIGHVRQHVNSSVPRTNQNKVTNRARFRCSPKPSSITLSPILPPLKRGPKAISTRKSSARTRKAAGLLDAAPLDGTYDKWMYTKSRWITGRYLFRRHLRQVDVSFRQRDIGHHIDEHHLGPGAGT
jgi:hypothetical protein